MFFKRQMPVIIMITIGLLTLLSNFIIEGKSDNLDNVTRWVNDDSLLWFGIIAAFAILLGAFNLLKIHLSKILRNNKDYPYSIFLILGFCLMIFSGFFYHGVDRLGNEQYDEGEKFIDLNDNEKWDDAESFTDLNGNQKYDKGEKFKDIGNGKWDAAETYEDIPNGKWDKGEDFIDKNGNGSYDIGETYKDIPNGKWDKGEDFIDKNGNGSYDIAEEYTDTNENGKWDTAEKYIDTNQNDKYDKGEKFKDIGNGKWDEGEDFIDVNGNGSYDIAEEYTDSNENGKWDAAEIFKDVRNRKWDEGEDFIDINGNGSYDTGETYQDIPNGKWDEGEDFIDKNGNGSYDIAEEYTDSNENGKWDAAEKYVDTPNGKWDAAEKYVDTPNGKWDAAEIYKDDNWGEHLFGKDKSLFSKLFNLTIDPLESTMFALLAFFVASASYRAFRIRNFEASLLLVSGIFVMIGAVPFGSYIPSWVFAYVFLSLLFVVISPFISDKKILWTSFFVSFIIISFAMTIWYPSFLNSKSILFWILAYPTRAGKTAIMIGVALGVAATSLRIIFGKDKSFLGD